MRKKLPKAVGRTADEMREAIAVGAAATERAGRTPESPPDNVIAMAPKPEADAARVAEAAAAPAPEADESDPARRLQALTIVQRHATYAAAGGIIPVPLVNFAGVMAVIVRMVRALSGHYGVPFRRDRARAIVTGLVGGAMPTGVGAITALTLVHLVPGANLIGLAASSATAAACTRSIGRIFVEHFESGATLDDFPTIARR